MAGRLHAPRASERQGRERSADVQTDFDADAFAKSIPQSILRRFFDYWLAKKGSREMPTRADLDPLDFAYALGHLILVDVERDPMRFRFRLYGTALTNFFRDGDYTGKYADELLPPDYAPYVVELYRTAVQARIPRYARRDLVMNNQRLSYDALTLPLADPDNPADIAMLVVLLIPLEKSTPADLRRI
jgi:hypothetical protein